MIGPGQGECFGSKYGQGVLGAIAVVLLALAACTPDGESAKPVTSTQQAAVTPVPGKVTQCNALRSDRYREEAHLQALRNPTAAGILVPILVFGTNTPSRDGEIDRTARRVAEARDKAFSLNCPERTSATLEQTKEARALTDGAYEGRAKADHWCYSPTIKLTIDNGSVRGGMWQKSLEKPTSIVKGNITPNGVLQLQFDGTYEEYITADVDTELKDSTISFALAGEKNCVLAFVLKKAP